MNLKKTLSIYASAVMAATVLIGCGGDNNGAGPGPGPGPGQEPDTHFNPKINYGPFTDLRDKKTYRTTVIDGVTWMAENLNYDNNDSAWTLGGDIPANSMCYLYHAPNCEKYGRLYMGLQRFDACPAGWRLPDTADVRKLMNRLMQDNRYRGMKAMRGWPAYDEGTDDYGFSALPGGYYDENRTDDAIFQGLLNYAAFWTSTEPGYLYSDFVVSPGVDFTNREGYEYEAHSVRCIKND